MEHPKFRSAAKELQTWANSLPSVVEDNVKKSIDALEHSEHLEDTTPEQIAEQILRQISKQIEAGMSLFDSTREAIGMPDRYSTFFRSLDLTDVGWSALYRVLDEYHNDSAEPEGEYSKLIRSNFVADEYDDIDLIFGHPATESQNQKLRDWADGKCPDSLADFYREMDGVTDGLYSIVHDLETTIQTTNDVRSVESETYLGAYTWSEIEADPSLMDEFAEQTPLRHLILISDYSMGNGDYFALVMKPSKNFVAGQVILWEHENGTSQLFANDLSDFIVKLGNDALGDL